MRNATWPILGVLLAACGGSPDDAESTSEALSEAGSVHVSRDATGALRLETGRPARVSSCTGAAACVDADGDGLVDAWESAVLEHMRPFVTFDEGEPLVENGDVFASVGRVAPFGQN